ncbi:MAG: hypothetical protein UT31_C0021G0011 [Parcubacteria group bacterium GW2011_GWF2_39_13b]|nr:MAG: hypothetical protein UT31_C0021G0011 [Parcubacteria group bacterium GW2011_GWF2_39_13b]
MKQKGFTLIELLVVISIIGLLASIVLVSLNSARSKSRNSKRNANIQQLKTAFNMAADANNGIFVTTSTWACVSISCSGGFVTYVANPTVDAFFTPYISAKPEDPADSRRSSSGYLYYNSWAGGTGTDGFFAAGPYLYWMLEPATIAPGVCGPGRVYRSGTNFVRCMLKLN